MLYINLKSCLGSYTCYIIRLRTLFMKKSLHIKIFTEKVESQMLVPILDDLSLRLHWPSPIFNLLVMSGILVWSLGAGVVLNALECWEHWIFHDTERLTRFGWEGYRCWVIMDGVTVSLLDYFWIVMLWFVNCDRWEIGLSE